MIEQEEEQQLRKKRAMAAYRIISLSQQMMGVQDNWRVASDYVEIFASILTQFPGQQPSFEELKDFVFQPPEIREGQAKATQVLNRAKSVLPFEGIRVLEIGGPFGQVLHFLGADVTCIDPDIEGESEWHGNSWTYLPRTRQQLYQAVPVRLTQTNWPHYVKADQFDITLSREVLSRGSGTSSDWRWVIKNSNDYGSYSRVSLANATADEQIRQLLFDISGFATRTNRLVLHQGDAIHELLPQAPAIGLKLVDRPLPLFDGPCSQLYVFRKNE